MRALLTLILIVTVFISPTLAQQDVYKWKLGVAGGLLTEGDKITYPNSISSYFYGIQGQFRMSPSFSGRVELTKSYFDKRPLRHDSRLILGVVYNFDNHRILSDRAKVAPYIMLGGGYSSYTRTYAELAITNGDWNAAGEIGIKFRLSDRFDLNLFSSLHYPINRLNFVRFGAGGLTQRFGVALNLNMGLRKSDFNAPSYYIGADHEVFNPVPAKRSLLVTVDTVPAPKKDEPVWGYAAANENEFETVQPTAPKAELSDTLAVATVIDSVSTETLDSTIEVITDSIIPTLLDSTDLIQDSLALTVDSVAITPVDSSIVITQDSVEVALDSVTMEQIGTDSLSIPASIYTDSAATVLDAKSKSDSILNAWQAPDFAGLDSRPPNAFQMETSTPAPASNVQPVIVDTVSSSGQATNTVKPVSVNAQPQSQAQPTVQQMPQPQPQYSGAVSDQMYQQRYAQPTQPTQPQVQNYYYSDPGMNQAPVTQPSSFPQYYPQGAAVQPIAQPDQFGYARPNHQTVAPGSTLILPQLAGRSEGMTFKDTLMFEMMRSMQMQLDQLKSQPQVLQQMPASGTTDQLLIRELVAAYKDMNNQLKDQLQKAEAGAVIQKPMSQKAAVPSVDTSSGNSTEIFFEPNSWSLDAEKRGILNQWIAGLNEASMLVVTGTADSAGDKEYNKKVSRYRAEAVFNHLRSKGIADSRISLRYTGEEYATGPTNKDDRRVTVEVIIIK